MINIARKYAYLALDDKYKKSSDPSIEDMLKPKEWYCIEPIPKKDVEEKKMEQSGPSMLKEMKAKNPALEKLVGDLGLDSGEMMFNENLASEILAFEVIPAQYKEDFSGILDKKDTFVGYPANSVTKPMVNKLHLWGITEI